MRMYLYRVRWIVGAALAGLLLAGCGMVRLGYSQAPSLVYWWIDGYADLSDAQTPPLREAIEQWFDWHRRTRLADYVALLQRAQAEVLQPITPQAMCRWGDALQARFEVAVEQATPALAVLMITLSPEQLRHIERKQLKAVEELRAEYAQGNRAERALASFKRTLERYETLYGSFDKPQRARLSHRLGQSSFDADRWLDERERRNRDLLQTLTQVSSGARVMDSAPAQVEAEAAVRMLVEHTLRSPRPEHRTYQERLSMETCELAATVHNLTTSAQRQQAQRTLKDWEADVRLLVGSVTANPGGGIRRKLL